MILEGSRRRESRLRREGPGHELLRCWDLHWAIRGTSGRTGRVGKGPTPLGRVQSDCVRTKSALGLPELNQLVRVRGRHWVVAEVRRGTVDASPQGAQQVQHLVELTSVEDDGLGDAQRHLGGGAGRGSPRRRRPCPLR